MLCRKYRSMLTLISRAAPNFFLVQLDWFGNARARLPDDSRTFPFASYAVEGDAMVVRLLNPDVVTKDVPSSAALAKAIADNKDNPNLFRDKMVFQKVKN